MAVIKAKPEKIIAFYLGLLERELVTPMVVTRANSEDFKGAQGDTVTLKIGGLRAVARDYEFRTRTAPIQLDDIQGGESIAITLDSHVYSATSLTDEQMLLDDIGYATDVVAPQVAAVVADFEAKVVAGLRGTLAKHTISITADSDPHLVALEAKRLMDSDKVAPRSGRVYLVGTDVAAAWLASDRLSLYTSTGQDGTPALRDAIIGQLAGSPVVESNALNPDEAYYLHKTALVLGNLAPLVPAGVTAGRTGISKNGFAVRWIADYDPNYLRDRSVVSSFLGVNDVRDERDPATGDLRAADWNSVAVAAAFRLGTGTATDIVTGGNLVIGIDAIADVTVALAALDTPANVVTKINAGIGATGTASLVNGALKIVSATTGVASVVEIVSATGTILADTKLTVGSNSGSAAAIGPRNVRVIKFDFEGGGSVL